jgi:DNA-binding NarL/FixJ family response regulator
MPRVLIIDDHPIVRMGVRAMLEQTPGFEVCGEAGSTSEALRLLSAENPDVTLLDLMLGGRGGADFVTECLRACPGTRILSCLSTMKRSTPNVCSTPEHTATS